ncbi:acyltransferase family protein [Carboxylicivirga sp. RSCT41]|uniref:acyltransferase family protein n=1 Tax=Carboxylicivirga agarovorans TaxID=3417570 RepID=UPI003D32A809
MTNQSERLYYLDWLRVFAFGLLFVFHAARFFDDFGWHVKNEDHSTLVNLLVGFTHGWRMHLIFFISGAGTFFALRSRKKLFVADRFKRLIVPYLFGIVLLVPPQKFLEAISNEWFSGSFLQFLAGYPAWLMNYHPGVTLEWTGHLGYHIWYLAFLFVMTLVFIPLLKLISKPSLINRVLQYLSNKKLGLLVFIVPVVVTEVLLRPNHGDYLNWADFFQYGMFFIAGYIFMTQQGFIELSRKYTYMFLIAGIGTSAYILTHYPTITEGGTIFKSAINSTILVSSSFSWVLFFLGISQRKLNFNHKYLNRLNSGVLPFYILHQTVIIVIGFYIVGLEYSILTKYTIILISSLIATLALYQLIQRISALRLLFGMKVQVSHQKSRNEENGNTFFRNFYKKAKLINQLK